MPRNEFNYHNFFSENRRPAGFCNNPCHPKPCQCCCVGPAGPQGPAGRQGPTGPTGAPGASILGYYDTYAEFIAAHPTGNRGDAYLVGGELYVWDEATGAWLNMGSLIGPTGPTGVPGASILDSYDTYAEFIAAHPTGAPGDAYLVGGELYVWDEATGTWLNMGSLIGPTGPTGVPGASILDSYDTYAEFIAAHPTGAPGDAYLVGGELYVWDEATETWADMGSLIGPTGPIGEIGPTGADGLIGQIGGIVDTEGDLPTSGVEQGTIFYVEEDDGVYVYDAQAGWKMVSLAQGPRGATGPTGPTGPRGEDGMIGPIKGVVQAVSDLPTSGVEQGDIFYVEQEDGLYVWDAVNGWSKLGVVQGPRGVTGPTGPQGSAGAAASSYMIVPFASGEAPKTFATNGEPSTVTLLGFGYGDRRGFLSLEAADYSIPIDPSNYSFSLTLNADNDNKQVVFSLPFDVSIRSIYITAGNYGVFSTDYAVFPFVQLFSAEAGTNNFVPIEGAVAIPEQGIGPGQDVPADTMRSGHVDGLDIKLKAGTRIGIGAMMKIPGHTGGSEDYWIYFTGGIGMTYEPGI